MLTLFIVRHGEAAPHTVIDFNRTLTPLGIEEVEKVARQCLSTGDTIDILYKSPSVRTEQTAEVLLRTLNVVTVKTEIALYNSSIDEYMSVINQTGDSLNTAMIVGHNPVVTELLSFLTGESVHSMPTGSCAIVVAPFEHWSLLSRHTCMFRQLFIP